jgi:hypothetical protein
MISEMAEATEDRSNGFACAATGEVDSEAMKSTWAKAALGALLVFG